MRKLILFFSLISLNGLVIAETFHGTTEIDGSGAKVGRKVTIAFTYTLNMSDKEKITGDVNITGGRSPCFRDYKIVSGSIRGENVILTTEALDGNCGPFTFKGKFEGKEIVGTIPFGGESRAISLRPS